MLKKILGELNNIVSGELTTSKVTRDYYSTDCSVFQVEPKAVFFPKNKRDVSEMVRYLYDLACEGKKLPLTVRGKGTDLSGAAIGNGIVMVMPTHMNRKLGLYKQTVRVQSGMAYKELETLLHHHGRFLPPYPSSIDFASVGGAVGNNTAGEKSMRYGVTKDYVKSLEVVLSNGEIVEFRHLSKREFRAKLNLNSFEGDIYRRIKELIENNQELLDKSRPDVSKNAAGYNLWDTLDKRGGIDLTKLIVGSQGTLGIVTEIEFIHQPYQPDTELIAVFCQNIEEVDKLILGLSKYSPSSLEVVDHNLLEVLSQSHPRYIKGLVPEDFPKLMLLVEFDNKSKRVQKYYAKRAIKLIEKYGMGYRQAKTIDEAEAYWRIRHGAAAVLAMQDGRKKALPVIEDLVVPMDKMVEFIAKINKLFKKYNLSIAIWGHGGDANFHMQPYFDLGSKADRDQMLKFIDEVYKMVIKLGGSTAGEHNDGLIRGKYLKELYGARLFNVMKQTKDIFDPQGILNPYIKTGAENVKLDKLLRKSYDMSHLSDHMPQIL